MTVSEVLVLVTITVAVVTVLLVVNLGPDPLEEPVPLSPPPPASRLAPVVDHLREALNDTIQNVKVLDLRTQELDRRVEVQDALLRMLVDPALYETVCTFLADGMDPEDAVEAARRALS